MSTDRLTFFLVRGDSSGSNNTRFFPYTSHLSHPRAAYSPVCAYSLWNVASQYIPWAARGPDTSWNHSPRSQTSWVLMYRMTEWEPTHLLSSPKKLTASLRLSSEPTPLARVLFFERRCPSSISGVALYLELELFLSPPQPSSCSRRLSASSWMFSWLSGPSQEKL